MPRHPYFGFRNRPDSSGKSLAEEFSIICIANDIRRALDEMDIDKVAHEDQTLIGDALAAVAIMLQKKAGWAVAEVIEFIHHFYLEGKQHHVFCTEQDGKWFFTIKEIV